MDDLLWYGDNDIVEEGLENDAGIELEDSINDSLYDEFDELEEFLEEDSDITLDLTDEIKDLSKKYRNTFYLNFGGLLPFVLIKESPETLKKIILLGRVIERTPKNLENFYKSLLPLDAYMDVQLSSLKDNKLTEALILSNYFKEGLKVVKDLLDYNSFNPVEFMEESTEPNTRRRPFDEILTTPEISYRIKNYVDKLFETGQIKKLRNKVNEYVERVISRPTDLSIDVGLEELVSTYSNFLKSAYYSDESIPIEKDVEELTLLDYLGLPTNIYLTENKDGEPIIITNRDTRIKQDYKFNVYEIQQEDLDKFINTTSVTNTIQNNPNVRVLHTILTMMLYYIYFENASNFNISNDILTNIEYI